MPISRSEAASFLQPECRRHTTRLPFKVTPAYWLVAVKSLLSKLDEPSCVIDAIIHRGARITPSDGAIGYSVKEIGPHSTPFLRTNFIRLLFSAPLPLPNLLLEIISRPGKLNSYFTMKGKLVPTVSILDPRLLSNLSGVLLKPMC